MCEVKSLPAAGTEDRQLRLGIGQVLDYQALMARRNNRVRAVLATERAPSDPRWSLLCEAHGIVLVWPETFSVLLDRELTGYTRESRGVPAATPAATGANGHSRDLPPWPPFRDGSKRPRT